MGLRIHKLIGYGFNNLDKKTLKRINRIREDDGGVFTVAEFAKYLEKNKAELLKYIPKEFLFGVERALLMTTYGENIREDSIGDSIHLDTEFGDEKTLLIIPPYCKDWARYDNIIDYIEASETGDIEPKVTVLNRGIYPFTKGEIPVSVIGILHWLDLLNLVDTIKPLHYVYWA